MRWGDMLDVLALRAQHLNLGVDEVQLEIALWGQMIESADIYWLSAFTARSEALFQTATGTERYPLPPDFGRLLPFKEKNKTGIRLYDGTAESDLTYKEPIAYFEQDRTTNGRPGNFTILDGQWWLNPPPDANGTTGYRGRGLYVKRVDRIELDDVIPIDEPSALINMTLFQLAADKGLPQATALASERNAALSALVNNEARKRLAFYTQQVTLRRGRR